MAYDQKLDGEHTFVDTNNGDCRGRHRFCTRCGTVWCAALGDDETGLAFFGPDGHHWHGHGGPCPPANTNPKAT